MPDYEKIVTRRDSSYFAKDLETHNSTLNERISGARIVVIGAAGSIGSSVVRVLLRHNPRAICLIDLSENNLVEVVRDLRSTDGIELPEEFSTLPIGLGTVEFDRFFQIYAGKYLSY